MTSPVVTITIPHYQTEELVKLCLRSIRRHTVLPYRVVVVDNGSTDGSLAYLRSVAWITLIERNGENIKPGAWAHGSALDIGIAHTDTEFFLALHSDVFVKRAGWLGPLLAPFQHTTAMACVGAGKLEVPSFFRKALKRVEARWQRALGTARSGIGTSRAPAEYVRTTCALYRTGVIKKEDLSFLPRDEQGWTSGQGLFYALTERGYETRFLSPQELGKEIDHLNHGTMVLNPSLGARKRTIARGMAALRRRLLHEQVQSILRDSSLDR